MKQVLLLILLVAVISCKNFETKKLSSDELIQEEMRGLDFANLDTYPTFKSCDSVSSDAAVKRCFEAEVTKHIYELLGQHEVTLKDSIYEEINLVIIISSKGKPNIDQAEISEELEEQIPNIRKWLDEGVSGLPKIYPAEKRGVPVSSKFKLPLVIQSD